MSFRKELIILPKEFAFDMFDGIGSPDNEQILHFHDCLEINYVERGNGINIIEDKTYQLVPGDFYVINNLEHHMGFSNGSLCMKVMYFDPVFIWQNNSFDYEYLAPFFERNVHFSNKIEKNNPFSGELLNLMKEIECEWINKNEGYQLLIKALLMKFLAILYRYFKTTDKIGDDIKPFNMSYNRIRNVIEYIHLNYEKKLLLSKLAQIAYMNREYFSTYFKKVMQINVSNYIEAVRINTSCIFLKTSDKNITEICLECGFSNISHFNRSFKKITGVTPNEYRKIKISKF